MCGIARNDGVIDGRLLRNGIVAPVSADRLLRGCGSVPSSSWCCHQACLGVIYEEACWQVALLELTFDDEPHEGREQNCGAKDETYDAHVLEDVRGAHAV